MKKIFILLCFLPFLSKGQNTYNIVSGTNCISIAGNRFPLNSLVLRIAKDSVKCQFFNVNGYGDAYDFSPITLLDSAIHYLNNGTKLNSVSSVDSLYQAKFVK